ncbi:MAG: septum formation initiator family protein [Bacilli bacterium]|nr:septum formation initiator family protein [Bacilli bacterium]
MTKRKTRKEKKRLVFISVTIVALLISLVGTLYTDFMKIMENKKNTILLTSEYQSLLDEQEILESEVTKMQDPNYIARYAKEKYLYSSEGEIIIRID